MNANESFEMAAEAFYKATGMLMPGKDISAGAGWTDEREEERKKLFKVWCAAIEYMHKARSLAAEEPAQGNPLKGKRLTDLKDPAQGVEFLRRLNELNTHMDCPHWNGEVCDKKQGEVEEGLTETLRKIMLKEHYSWDRSNESLLVIMREGGEMRLASHFEECLLNAITRYDKWGEAAREEEGPCRS